MKVFQQAERKQDSTNTSKRPEEEIAKVTETRRWTDTHRHLLCSYCILLLWETLCASSQLSASSRKLKITETGLCCVCRVPNTRMLQSDTDHQVPLDKPDFPHMLSQFVLLFPWAVLAGNSSVSPVWLSLRTRLQDFQITLNSVW